MKNRYRLLVEFGIDPRKTVRGIAAMPNFLSDLKRFKRELNGSTAEFTLDHLYPCLHDRSDQGGVAKGQYFHQDLSVARRIFLNEPQTHLDVGSRIDGFVAHVATFREIVVADIREVSAQIPNIRFVRLDLMNPPPTELIEFCDSLSCLHAIEHFGLGRYGDPINPQGHLVGLRNLSVTLKRGGKFYFSMPIGPQRIEFNAHRIFAMHYLLANLTESFQIDRFSYVDDRGDFHEDAGLKDTDVARNFGCNFGLGIFEMTKR